MSIVIGWLSERNRFVARHRKIIEFALEMMWWVILWGLMISHRLMLNQECLMYNESMFRKVCFEYCLNLTNISLPIT